MTAPVSVIIPTLNAVRDLPACLEALTQAAVDGLVSEVIFADGGSTDEIEALADATGARLVRAKRGRGHQLATAALVARSGWLMFLHADTRPLDGWIGAVRDHLERAPDHAAFFKLRFRSSHPMSRVTAAWANIRARVLALPYGDQGLLIPASLYERIGGYPDIPLMEDVAIADRLGRRHLRGLDATLETSAARYERDGWLRRGRRNLTTLMLYRLGVDPAHLVARYERQ